MTLSGTSDRQHERETAREARRTREERSAAKHPWLLPLIVGAAVVLVVVGVVWELIL